MPTEKRPRLREQRDEAIVEYKRLTRAARKVCRNDDPRKALDLVADGIERSTTLYPLVSKKLDGTAADARHAKEISLLGKETANHINVTQRNINLRKLLHAIRRQVEIETGKLPDAKEFNEHLATEFACSYRPPTFEFFYGTICENDLEAKEKKVRLPRERDAPTQSTTAKEKNIDIDVDQDKTPMQVEEIYDQIKQLSLSKTDNIPFFDTLVDPDSFVRTIENIFHTSILVKEGKVGVKFDDKRRKTLLTVDEEAPDGGDQSILSFSFQNYKKWISRLPAN